MRKKVYYLILYINSDWIVVNIKWGIMRGSGTGIIYGTTLNLPAGTAGLRESAVWKRVCWVEKSSQLP